MQTKSPYGIYCDHELKEAVVNEQSKHLVAEVFQNALKKRNQLAEKQSLELHTLMQMHINQENMSEYQKNLCQLWQNLNDAIEGMQTFFWEEYKREVTHFNSTTKCCVYKFLGAFEQFESIYREEK